MSKPKIFVFAPREEPEDIRRQLETAGFHLSFGNKEWSTPGSDHEQAMAAGARDAVAMMGTSIRATPVSRRVMESSQRLRIVAKYSVGVDDRHRRRNGTWHPGLSRPHGGELFCGRGAYDSDDAGDPEEDPRA
jgi:phosphoglycerate dehydrogenase-like enzyme